MEGLVCGRYRIVRRLGAGGMAEVWLGQHEVIDQQAAIKVLQSHMSANKMVAKRFLKEAQATVAIKHPGIVAIHDVGFVTYHGKERAYIVMELLQGETLTERLDREGVLPFEQARRIIKQLAGAMDAAHRLQIFHRDLKPDNLFLVADPEVEGGERIKVLDFGLAKQAAESGSLITTKGTVFGTPAYMAPEQCLDSGAIDGRADLYSIGCILFRLLCGRTPFVADDPLGLLKAQMYDAPPGPRSIRPDMPADLERLILKLLAKKPEDRLPDCQTLLSELVGAGAGVGNTLIDGLRDPTLVDDDDTQGSTEPDLQAPAGASPEAQTLVNPSELGVPVASPSDLDVTNRVVGPGAGTGPVPPAPASGYGPGFQGMPMARAGTGETSLSVGSGQMQLHPPARLQTPQPVAPRSRTGLFLLIGLSVASLGLVGAGVMMFLGKDRGDNGGDKEMAVVDAGGHADARVAVAGRASEVPVDVRDAVDAGVDAGAGAADAAPASDAGGKQARAVLTAAEVKDMVAKARAAFGDRQYQKVYDLCRKVLGSEGNSRHPEATRFITMAACKLGKESRARRYFKRVGVSSRSMVDAFCQREGIKLVRAAE